jgi:hypothetical protein
LFQGLVQSNPVPVYPQPVLPATEPGYKLLIKNIKIKIKIIQIFNICRGFSMFRRKLDSSLFKNRIVQGAILGNKNSTKLVPYICAQPDIFNLHFFQSSSIEKTVSIIFLLSFKKFGLRSGLYFYHVSRIGGCDDTLLAGHCHPLHSGLPEENQGKNLNIIFPSIASNDID